MEFRAESGSSFRLAIIGYEFPDNKDDYWDSNWLLVSVDVKIPQGAWSVTDPFLLAWEVTWLADWFDAVASQRQTENEMGFLEPNLWFEVIQPADSTRYLRIHFAAECLPPWTNRDRQKKEEVFVEFRLSDIDLHAAAESLRSQVSLYPQRGTR